MRKNGYTLSNMDCKNWSWITYNLFLFQYLLKTNTKIWGSLTNLRLTDLHFVNWLEYGSIKLLKSLHNFYINLMCLLLFYLMFNNEISKKDFFTRETFCSLFLSLNAFFQTKYRTVLEDIPTSFPNAPLGLHFFFILPTNERTNEHIVFTKQIVQFQFSSDFFSSSFFDYWLLVFSRRDVLDLSPQHYIQRTIK